MDAVFNPPSLVIIAEGFVPLLRETLSQIGANLGFGVQVKKAKFP